MLQIYSINAFALQINTDLKKCKDFFLVVQLGYGGVRHIVPRFIILVTLTVNLARF